MIETILATGFTALAATAAYVLGKRMGDSGGCNGHHWHGGPPNLGGLDHSLPPFVDSRSKLVTPTVQSNGVSIRVPQTEQCEDCRETRTAWTEVVVLEWDELRARARNRDVKNDA